MKKKRAAGYVAVIAALVGLSVVTPLVISSVSDYVVERVGGRAGADGETEEETETGAEETEDGLATIGFPSEEATETDKNADLQEASMSDASAASGDDAERTAGNDTAKTSERASGSLTSGDITVDDSGYYEPPAYASDEEEEAANREVYDDMVDTLASAEEVSADYRKNFNPVYDELSAGMMNSFISGREQDFYEAIANYCFGHYNTSFEIAMVRFDAILEDTDAKMTAILEFFTAEDMLDDTHTPDLAVCTYNKNTKAFVFFRSTDR